MPSIFELFDLTGRVALITGGAGYLGSSMSEALMEAGANVVVASRNVSKCQEIIDAFPKNRPKALAIRLDIRSEDSVKNALSKIILEFGRLDILINSGYSGPPRSKFETNSNSEINEALCSGISGLHTVINQALPFIKRSKKGVIINIGSIYNVVAPDFNIYPDEKLYSPIGYHMIKGATLQVTRYLASYLAPYGIRVNSISPGSFKKRKAIDEELILEKAILNKIPLRRIGEPWELKGLIVYLASDASSYLTGQNIIIDGGWTII